MKPNAQQHVRKEPNSVLVLCLRECILSDNMSPMPVLQLVRIKDKVLEPQVHLFTGLVGPDFILMDQHEAHRDNLVDEFLEREDIHRMCVCVCVDWPVISPDLTSMEHAWDILEEGNFNSQLSS
ncbi:hypothetical protein TNCV_2820601 [Trichonephila clavipes]|nr:hypothetical protein TNCV_2820601 [Trichonephila clavipes]